MRAFLILFLASLLLHAQSIDRLVDATGAAGAYTTIPAAMLASSPGDRILVMPGSYPPFQFSRGVHLVGLGADPSEVVIQRIAYHVSIPPENYDTLISNVTVRSADPLDVLSIHGNELAPGVLTIDGCALESGLFLRGGQHGFYLLVNNSRIEPSAGHGFSGEAAYVGGPGSYVDLRNTRITAWSADPFVSTPAGVAVRLPAGTSARITGCAINGGQGVAAGHPYSQGGNAVESLTPGLVDLRLDGGSVIFGGHAAGSAPGGHGTLINGSVSIGLALVTGGSGNPPGMAHGLEMPLSLSTNAHLELTPSFQFAENGISVSSGETVTISVGDGVQPAVFAVALATELPRSASRVALPLQNAYLVPRATWSATIPFIPGSPSAGLMFYAQGAVVDPGGNLVMTNAAAVRVDLP